MPRAVENNPTERIHRLMAEMEELIALIKGSERPGLLPRLPNYEAERVRQTLTYVRNVNRMRSRRVLNMDRGGPISQMRAKEAMFQEEAQRYADEMLSKAEEPEVLSIEEIEARIAEGNKRLANEIIERIGDSYKPVPSSELFSKVKPPSG